MKMNCDYCKKEINVKASQVKKSVKHFCCKEHFYKYRNEYNYHPVNNVRTYKKLLMLAKLRKERMIKNEQ